MQKATRGEKNNMFNVEACPYARFDFPTKKDDDICRFCFKWCTEESTVSDRYHQLQGKFTNRHPERAHDAQPPVGDDPHVVPVCDKCFVDVNGESIVVMGCDFWADANYRMND